MREPTSMGSLSAAPRRRLPTEIEPLPEKHQHRLRHHTIFEIRNGKSEALTAPGLALLKQRILAKSNDLLGKPLLKSVVFSDFSFAEQ